MTVSGDLTTIQHMSISAQTTGNVAQAGSSSRAGFLVKTYLHLAGAILLFGILSTLVQLTPIAEALFNTLAQDQFQPWISLAFFITFIGVSTIAHNWSYSDHSKAFQYLGLLAYVVAETIFFIPLIYIFAQGAPVLLGVAAGGTVLISLLLTLMVLTTRTNFSFLRGFLVTGGLLAMIVIFASFIFPGLASSFLFLGFMVLFACTAIIYETSKVLHTYPTDKYVAASLGLFASVMLLFWYILRFMLRLTRS